MYPHSVSLPALGISLNWENLMTLVAAAVALGVGPRLAWMLEGIEPARARRAGLAMTLVALYGGHLLWVYNQWSYVSTRTAVAAAYILLAPWNGLHAPGCALAVVLAAPWVFPRFGVPVAKALDLGPVVFGIALMLARFGCFLQGCCWGTRCNAVWCVSFPPDTAPFDHQRLMRMIPQTASGSLPVHPLQLYFAAAALAMAVSALFLYRRKKYDGQIALVGLLWFGASSAALEFFRHDFQLRAWVGPLPQLAWLGIMLCLVAIGGLLTGHVAHRRKPSRYSNHDPRKSDAPIAAG